MCAYINVNTRQMENNNKIVLIVEKKMGLDIEIIDYRWTVILLITVCNIFFFTIFTNASGMFKQYYHGRDT
jgi:hypothetical protein